MRTLRTHFCNKEMLYRLFGRKILTSDSYIERLTGWLEPPKTVTTNCWGTCVRKRVEEGSLRISKLMGTKIENEML